jgi:DNA-binding MarR family transcriptional regulator
VSTGRYAYNHLDPLFHVPARLGIATALYAHVRGLSFVQLREVCELSDGNLSRHLRRLESDGVVTVSKEFVGRVPRTSVRMTAAGRARFETYLENLRQVVERDAVTAAEREAPQGGELAHE